MSADDFRPNAGSYQLLNDSTASFSSRLRLCRALWVSKEYVVPRKYQLLLNWLCGRINSCVDSATDFRLCVETMIEFLNSNCLDEYLAIQATSSTVKPIVAQTVSEYLTTQRDAGIIKCLKILTEILFTNNRISSVLTSQYEQQTIFMSSWMKLTKSQWKINDTCSLEVVIFLLKRSAKSMRGPDAMNKALLPFCKNLLLPMLELHYMCSVWKSDNLLLCTELTESIESYLASVLFARENSKLYDELETANSEQKTDKEESSRRNKKVQRSKRLAAIMSTVQEIAAKNSSDESCAAHCVKLFFRLFLAHSNSDKKIRFKMLEELSKHGCMHDRKCFDIIHCNNMNLEMLNDLLQVTLDYRLYQPAVNHGQSEILSTWLKSIMENLVENYSPSSNWISCTELLAEIDKSIVEPRLKSVLLKLIGKGATLLTTQEINNLVHQLVNIYIRIRQSLRLVNILIIVIDGFALTKDTDVNTIKRITNIVEEFGCCIGKQFSIKLSPSLVIEIWSSILEKINSEVEKFSRKFMVKEDIQLADITTHQLLLKFFNKIVEETPIFALWDHMTARKKMDECVESFKSSVEILHNVAFPKHSSTVNQKCVENFLLACIIQVKMKNSLESYIEVKSGSIFPGFATSLFENESASHALSQNFVDDINPDYLMTENSKLYFIALSLIRIKKLSNDISVAEILGKTGRLSSKDSTDLHAVSKTNLNTLLETLESILRSIKPSAADWDDAALQDTLFHEVLVRMANFSTIIFCLDIPKIPKWLIDAVVFVMFNRACCSSEVQNAISEFFSAISTLSKASTTTFEVLCSSSRILSEVIPDMADHLDMSQNTAKEIPIFGKKKLPDFSIDELKSISRTMTYYIEILELCNLTNLPLEESVLVFANVVSCIRIVEHAFRKFTELDCILEMSNVKILLKSLVGVLLELANDKRVLILKDCSPAKLFIYLSSVKVLLGYEMQKDLITLLQELILSCYHNSTGNAFAVLEAGLARKCKDHIGATGDFDMEARSLHIKALIDMLSFDDISDQILSKKLTSKARKRKLRGEIQTFKKLKLENKDIGIQTVLFENLHQLYQDAVVLHKEENTSSGKSYFDMLSSSIKAYTLLKFKEDCQDIVKIDGYLSAELTSVLEDIQNERQIEVLIAKLRFVRSTLQVKEIDYKYESSHLKNLIQCYKNVSTHSQATMELERCICHFVQRFATGNFQKDIFNPVLNKIRFGGHDAAENYLKFSLVLLESNLLFQSGQSEDDKVEKSACSRFVKSLLEILTIMVSTKSKDVDTMQATTVSLMNNTISAIVKIKWIRLLTTEISSIFLSLRNIPLERIHDINGAEVFSKVFVSCCDVVHSVLLNHRDIGRIAAICNAAFRQLLRAAMHLGVQKANSTTRLVESIHGDTTYNTAILCAGRLEKLFQLVADNCKKDFAKCMSYVVADYTCVLTYTTIVPFVKKSFTNAIYHLVLMMDEYDTAMIRKALLPGVRDNFQELFLDFGRNFKYKGFV